jgi:hypothetical protein
MTQRTPLAAQWRSTLLAVFAISIFACSSDDNDNPAICGSRLPVCVTSEATSLLLNFTSDYDTGEIRWMNTDSECFLQSNIPFDQDSKVIAHNGQIFILEKTFGNLNCLNPSSISNPATIAQRKLHSKNPYDIAFVGSTGYIVMYDSDELETFNAATCALGARISFPDDYKSGISLSANAALIKASGDTLLIVLQRLEKWSAEKPGLLVRMRADGSLIDTIQLNFYNPGSSILNNGKLIVASNNFGFGDGIEIVDLASGTTEILLSGESLGGGAASIALNEDTQILYASVYAGWKNVPVKSINLSSKSVIGTLPCITDSYNGLVFDNIGKKLYIADNSGLKIYNPATDEIITAGNQDLPPYSLDIVRW